MSKRRILTHRAAASGPLEDLCLVLWHGAGGDVDQAHIVAVAQAAAAAGAHVARARFDYRMRGKRAPDRMPKLVAHARETVAKVRAARPGARLVLGGRSMGGRVATMLAAEGDPVHGLLLLSYPLHPAGKPDKLRDAHLYALEAPMLFLTGDRDALAKMDLFEPVLSRLGARATTKVYPGADHGFAKAPPEAVAADAQAWLTQVVSCRAGSR